MPTAPLLSTDRLDSPELALGEAAHHRFAQAIGFRLERVRLVERVDAPVMNYQGCRRCNHGSRTLNSMAKAIGRPELADDPRFATGPDRAKNQNELIAIIEGWMASLESDEAVLKVLEDCRIAASPVMTVADSVTHPYFLARKMIRTVPDPVLGEVTIPGFPLKFSEFPELLDIRAPLLGEHRTDFARLPGNHRSGSRAAENEPRPLLGRQVASPPRGSER